MKKNSKNSRKKKTTPQEVVYEHSYQDPSTKGLIPMMYDLVELLPEDTKPHGKRIVDILTMSVTAFFAIFLIGALVATLTGHEDQIMNIFSVSITSIGIMAVGAIVLTVKKTIN